MTLTGGVGTVSNSPRRGPRSQVSTWMVSGTHIMPITGWRSDYWLAHRETPSPEIASVQDSKTTRGVATRSAGRSPPQRMTFTPGAAGTLGASLGLDTSGTTGDVVQGNSFRGPIVVQSAGHTIGGTVAGSGNLIDGALWLGLGNPGCSGVVIEGNLIGTNAQGTSGVEEESGGGIGVDDATDCTIGGMTAAARNLISDNETGIEVDSSSGIVIEGNYIGTDITGESPIGNLEGISIDSGSGITIGGTTSGAGNVISANPNGELSVSGSDVLVAGNLIGTNANGTAAMPNPGDGESTEFTVTNNGPGITIGGTTAGSGNVIGGSNGLALHFMARTSSWKETISALQQLVYLWVTGATAC